MFRRVFLLALIFAIVLGCFTACGEKSDEELIEKRIESFVKTYNAGDLDKLIENLSYSERTEMQSYITLIEGIGFSYGGASGKLDLSAIFGIAMGSTTDGDMMGINIESINITDESHAEVSVSVRMKNKYMEETQSGRIDMVKEDGDWFIKDMNTWESTDGTNSSSSTLSGNNTNASTHTTTGRGKITLDPFQGLQYTVTGISPYCEISVNDQNCSDEVQSYVRYSFDKEYYANGDTAIITAELYYGGSEYQLSDTTYELRVLNRPEYVTSLSGVDTEYIEQELEDYISSKIASAYTSYDLLSYNVGWYIETLESVTQEAELFSSLKASKTSEFEMGYTPFNKLSYIYAIRYTYDTYSSTQTATTYFNIEAQNIIKYTDGSVSWGTYSNDELSFECAHSTVGVQDCITTTVMTGSINYNISQIN